MVHFFDKHAIIWDFLRKFARIFIGVTDNTVLTI